MLNGLKYFLVAMLLMAVVAFLAMFALGDSPKKEKIGYAAKEKSAEKTTPKKAKLESSDKSNFQSDSTSEATSEPTIEKPSGTASQSTAPNEPSTSITGESFFQNLKNSYLSPILAELPEGRSREDVVVRYYTHNMDNDRVYALRSLGYYLHEKEPEDSEDLESNVLYYGKEVDIRDIQLVAYTLVKNGVPLRAIKQSQFDWKLSALEIGTDSLLQSDPLLTVKSIQEFTR